LPLSLLTIGSFRELFGDQLLSPAAEFSRGGRGASSGVSPSDGAKYGDGGSSGLSGFGAGHSGIVVIRFQRAAAVN
jgi:hypothetical protein